MDMRMTEDFDLLYCLGNAPTKTVWVFLPFGISSPELGI